MSKNKLTRKELKHDELQDALVDARDYVATHQKETTKWAAIAVGVAVVVLGVWGLVSLRSQKMGRRLSDALSTLNAPLVTDGTAAPGQKVYKDADERLADAKKQLTSLVADAPGSTAGRAAAVVLIGLEGTAGATPARLDAAKGLASSEEGTVSGGFAAASLLDAQAASGKVKEAIATAKAYLDASNPPLPKDYLVFTLAKLHEKAGQSVEAKSYYQRVVSDYPESSYRYEAQQKLASL